MNARSSEPYLEGGSQLPRSRPPIVRMRRIHEILSDGRPANCSVLVRELEMSTKTIQRNIDNMRDHQQLPIDYDASTRSYIYTRPVKTLPAFSITEADLLRWILSGADAVEVKYPRNLRDDTAAVFRRTAAKYRRTRPARVGNSHLHR